MFRRCWYNDQIHGNIASSATLTFVPRINKLVTKLPIISFNRIVKKNQQTIYISSDLVSIYKCSQVSTYLIFSYIFVLDIYNSSHIARQVHTILVFSRQCYKTPYMHSHFQNPSNIVYRLCTPSHTPLRSHHLLNSHLVYIHKDPHHLPF